MAHITAAPTRRAIGGPIRHGKDSGRHNMFFYFFTNSSDISDATDGAGIIETKRSISTPLLNRNLFCQGINHQLSKFF
jgi:hypothetical protein